MSNLLYLVCRDILINAHTPLSPETYISIKLKEDLIMVIIPKDWVRGKSLEENLVHGHRFLESSQILPA